MSESKSVSVLSPSQRSLVSTVVYDGSTVVHAVVDLVVDVVVYFVVDVFHMLDDSGLLNVVQFRLHFHIICFLNLLLNFSISVSSKGNKKDNYKRKSKLYLSH